VKPRRRWLVIALAAIGTGIAAWSGTPEGEAPQIAAVTPPAPSAAPAGALLELPKRQRLGPLRSSLFKVEAPPAPKPKPVQAEPPRPPPNPYRYVGSLEVGGQRRVLLATVDDKIVEASEGVRLEQGWRVQGVTPQAVTLVYEPLDEPVTVALVFPELPPRAPQVQAAQPQAATGQTALPPPQPNPTETRDERVRRRDLSK
jgi:hypothetical protein